LGGDFGWAASLLIKQDDMLIDRHAPLLAHLFIGFMPLKGQRLIDWLSALRGLISYLFDSVIVSTHDAHDHFSCILGKVETIRDLDCIRSCFSRRISHTHHPGLD